MDRMSSEQTQTTDQLPAETTAEQRDVQPAEGRTAIPKTQAFTDYIGSGWADRPRNLPALRPLAADAARRRQQLSARHVGERLVIAAGDAKVRSNDTDFPFRAHSAFSWLTAWGADSEPGAVLVFEPAGETHQITLHFAAAAGRDTDEFYANSAIGEFWVGPRPTLEQVGADLGVATAALAEFRPGDDDVTVDDPQLARDLSEARLVKDPGEIAEMRAAIAATADGFGDILRALPAITAHPRGERVIEGTFFGRARADGNDLGYSTIAASGAHACILHWTRNDGAVRPGDLVLIDAGVEMPSLYTADITRTIPVGGRFTPTQRQVYEAVREAADAAFAVVRPGVRFRQVHAAAMEVIARRTAQWGLPLAGTSLSEDLDGQAHRRYMVHGTSHHLGLDVHDCAEARRELYIDAEIRAGMVFTIEPGLYFQPDDLTVPAEFRGIGVRIEDDVLVTENGVENLSAAIPRTADDVEAWIASAR